MCNLTNSTTLSSTWFQGIGNACFPPVLFHQLAQGLRGPPTQRLWQALRSREGHLHPGARSGTQLFVEKVAQGCGWCQAQNHVLLIVMWKHNRQMWNYSGIPSTDCFKRHCSFKDYYIFLREFILFNWISYISSLEQMWSTTNDVH